MRTHRWLASIVLLPLAALTFAGVAYATTPAPGGNRWTSSHPSQPIHSPQPTMLLSEANLAPLGAFLTAVHNAQVAAYLQAVQSAQAAANSARLSAEASQRAASASSASTGASAPTTSTTSPPATYGGNSAYWSCIIAHESGGNPTAMNPSGAAGLYQIMPGTWGGYDGYASAADAPVSVQTERAQQIYNETGGSAWQDGC